MQALPSFPAAPHVSAESMEKETIWHDLACIYPERDVFRNHWIKCFSNFLQPQKKKENPEPWNGLMVVDKDAARREELTCFVSYFFQLRKNMWNIKSISDESQAVLKESSAKSPFPPPSPLPLFFSLSPAHTLINAMASRHRRELSRLLGKLYFAAWRGGKKLLSPTDKHGHRFLWTWTLFLWIKMN